MFTNDNTSGSYNIIQKQQNNAYSGICTSYILLIQVCVNTGTKIVINTRTLYIYQQWVYVYISLNDLNLFYCCTFIILTRCSCPFHHYIIWKNQLSQVFKNFRQIKNSLFTVFSIKLLSLIKQRNIPTSKLFSEKSKRLHRFT